MPCCATKCQVPVPPRLLVQREQPQETQAGPDLCAGLCWGAQHLFPEMTSEGEPAHTSQNHTKMAHTMEKPPWMVGLGCLDGRRDSLQNAQKFFPLPHPREHFKSTKRKIKYFFLSKAAVLHQNTFHTFPSALPSAGLGFTDGSGEQSGLRKCMLITPV